VRWNPVFLNELRQSPLRRRPLQAFSIWIAASFFLMWLTSVLGGQLLPILLVWLPTLILPIVVPAFAAGTFAKEYEQQTWQDLYLTLLTNYQVVLGKFWAALLQVCVILSACLPPAALALYTTSSTYSIGFLWWFESFASLAFRLTLSAALYVALAMVCSRYSGNRRAALVWSYIALFLYGGAGAMVWKVVGADVDRAFQVEVLTGNNAAGNMAQDYEISREMAMQSANPGFMQGLHLLFCLVVGLGCVILLWVSMSEQRGYRGGEAESNRSWQPIREVRPPVTGTKA
jgi:ABC-type transport system involved in multi-copper enzyme maturation permease subunit